MKPDLYLARIRLNLEVDDIRNDNVRLRPNLRVFDSPNLEVERLDSTVPEAELMNFHCMRIPMIAEFQ